MKAILSFKVVFDGIEESHDAAKLASTLTKEVLDHEQAERCMASSLRIIRDDDDDED